MSAWVGRSEPVRYRWGEYDQDRSHGSHPAAYGANGPDTIGNHTLLPIQAFCLIPEHRSAKPRQDGHDYVERITQRKRGEQGKRGRFSARST